MTVTGVSVVVPVGPHESNRRWLRECLESVCAQTLRATDVVLVDDSGDPDFSLSTKLPLCMMSQPFQIWHSPWTLGVASAFNVGVAVARERLVFMLGSDDTLEPDCLDACYDEYRRCDDPIAYYSVGVRYMDTGEVQTAPCHAAMVTRGLWRLTGGFPIASAVGAPDAALLSIMFKHGARAGRIRPVADGRPLYNYRRHDASDTARKGPWQEVILAVRDLVTREWQPR